MPKMKTHKASKKRFRVTATGKLKRRQAGKKHLQQPQDRQAQAPPARRRRGRRQAVAQVRQGDGRQGLMISLKRERGWTQSSLTLELIREEFRAMTRARSGKTVLRGRKRMRKLTKGFRLSRHNLYRQSVVTLIRAPRLRLPRSPRPQARVPPAVDRPHQRRLPDARPALQPVHRRPAARQRRAEPQDAGRTRHPRSRHVHQDRRAGEGEPARRERQNDRVGECGVQ